VFPEPVEPAEPDIPAAPAIIPMATAKPHIPTHRLALDRTCVTSIDTYSCPGKA
jgi:hypothetical protein